MWVFWLSVGEPLLNLYGMLTTIKVTEMRPSVACVRWQRQHTKLFARYEAKKKQVSQKEMRKTNSVNTDEL